MRPVHVAVNLDLRRGAVHGPRLLDTRVLGAGSARYAFWGPSSSLWSIGSDAWIANATPSSMSTWRSLLGPWSAPARPRLLRRWS